MDLQLLREAAVTLADARRHERGDAVGFAGEHEGVTGEFTAERFAAFLGSGSVGCQDGTRDHVDGLLTALVGLGVLDSAAVVGVLHEEFEAVEVDVRPAQGAHLAAA